MKCGMRRLAELGEAPRGACWSPKEGESVRAAGCQERHLRTKWVEGPSGIGDLVLAAELMEVTGASPCYAQHWGGTQPAMQHDQAAYGIPQEPAALGRMVRELQEMVHRQSQLLQSSQEALAASQEHCQELQERSESECWVLASELGQRIAALEAENRNLRCERDQLESRTRGLREELEWSRSSMLHVVRPEPQLFLVLVRLGLLLQDLAFRFQLSEATVSRYWLSWTQLMETRLAQGCRCGAARVERFEPQRASRVGGVPWVVLDCAQLRFEGRGRQLYALQGCAVAAPSGFLAFCCSAALPGGEGGNRAGVAPLPVGRPVALSAQQGEACLQVLSLASLADKALCFRFLHGVQPPTMEGQVGRAWAICCYLACLLHEPMGLA
ncbi:unnamed protein product [Lepidochelys olivacea]